jgi:hypothetical protein
MFRGEEKRTNIELPTSKVEWQGRVVRADGSREHKCYVRRYGQVGDERYAALARRPEKRSGY